nr:reverse transcriptase domain, reverse transcriptase zinc-binding domain protein [Tanacetum cinerariifolium]
MHLIKGVSLGHTNLNVSHFFFADDVVILTKGDSNDKENIIQTLNTFHRASSLKINIAKSNVFGIGVSEDNLQSMAYLAGYLACTFPFSYLSIPIDKSMKFKDSWNLMIDKFKAKLSKWKANLLSIGCRLTFFWGGGGDKDHSNMAWVKWDTILASLDQGGLGVRSLKAFNLALLQKWRWRLITKSDSLWVKVIKAIHVVEAGFDEKGSYPNGTWWRRSVTFGRTKEMLCTLSNELRHTTLSSEPDSCMWSLSDDGLFSVAVTRRHIDQVILPSVIIATRWNNVLPKKSKFNTSLKKLKYHLGQFDTVVKKWITPDAITKEE